MKGNYTCQSIKLDQFWFFHCETWSWGWVINPLINHRLISDSNQLQFHGLKSQKMFDWVKDQIKSSNVQPKDHLSQGLFGRRINDGQFLSLSFHSTIGTFDTFRSKSHRVYDRRTPFQVRDKERCIRIRMFGWERTWIKSHETDQSFCHWYSFDTFKFSALFSTLRVLFLIQWGAFSQFYALFWVCNKRLSQLVEDSAMRSVLLILSGLVLANQVTSRW